MLLMTSWAARSFRIAALMLALGFAPVRAEAPPPGTRNVRTLIVSVDGLRPDLLLRARTPVLRGLLERGSFTFWAKTTAVAVTLPSHVSMLTGVAPGKHGIAWNSDLPLRHPIYPAWPTLFELARKSGRTTAMVAGKAKFSALATPGSLTWVFVPAQTAIPDRAVADTAATWIGRYAPEVMFVHLPEVDAVGHAEGWGSAAQLTAIEGADHCLGRLLDSLRDRGILDSTVIFVTADHGGAGRSHGADDLRSREIPWIVSGPGICKDLDLTTIEALEVRTEDTFATACWLLGITPQKAIDGHPVTQIIGCAQRP